MTQFLPHWCCYHFRHFKSKPVLKIFVFARIPTDAWQLLGAVNWEVHCSLIPTPLYNLHVHLVLTVIFMCVCSAAAHLNVWVWSTGIKTHAHGAGWRQPDTYQVQPRRRRSCMHSELVVLLVQFRGRQRITMKEGVPFNSFFSLPSRHHPPCSCRLRLMWRKTWSKLPCRYSPPLPSASFRKWFLHTDTQVSRQV